LKKHKIDLNRINLSSDGGDSPEDTPDGLMDEYTSEDDRSFGFGSHWYEDYDSDDSKDRGGRHRGGFWSSRSNRDGSRSGRSNASRSHGWHGGYGGYGGHGAYDYYNTSHWDRARGAYASSYSGFGSWSYYSSDPSARMHEGIRLASVAIMATDYKLGGMQIFFGVSSPDTSDPVKSKLPINGFIYEETSGDEGHDVMVGECLLASQARASISELCEVYRDDISKLGFSPLGLLTLAAAMLAAERQVERLSPGYAPYLEARREWYRKKSSSPGSWNIGGKAREDVGPTFVGNILKESWAGSGGYFELMAVAHAASNTAMAYAGVVPEGDLVVDEFPGDMKKSLAELVEACSRAASAHVAGGSISDLHARVAEEVKRTKTWEAFGDLFHASFDATHSAEVHAWGDPAVYNALTSSSLYNFYGCCSKPTLVSSAASIVGWFANQSQPDNMPMPENQDEVDVSASALWDPRESWENVCKEVDFRKAFSMAEELTDRIFYGITKIRAREIGCLKNALSFRANDVTLETPSWKSGEVDDGALHRVALGDVDVFARREERKLPNILFAVLLDRSGSMGEKASPRNGVDPTRWTVAATSAIIVGAALEGTPGVSTEFYSHTTCAKDSNHAQIEILKKAEDPVSKLGITKLVAAEAGNFDGPVIKELCRKLAKEKRGGSYDQVVLFVISDGKPCGGNDEVDAYNTVKRATEYGRAVGVEVYGIGIDGAYTQGEGDQMYGSGGYIVLKSVTELSSRLGRWITDMCSKEAK